MPPTPTQPATAALSAQTQSAAPVRELEDTATAVGAMAGGQTDGTATVKPDDAVNIGGGDSATPDSDGAATTIHVQGRAGSMPPAPPKAATSHAEAASKAAQRTQPEPRQDTALPQASAAPLPNAASGETMMASLLHAAQERRDGGTQVRSDRGLLAAGGLAAVGAVLTIVALFPTFTDQVPAYISVGQHVRDDYQGFRGFGCEHLHFCASHKVADRPGAPTGRRSDSTQLGRV